MERVARYGNEFKDLVVKVKEGGVELWMNRGEVVRNYHAAMEKVEQTSKNFKKPSREEHCQV